MIAQNVNWKLLELLADGWKDNPSTPELPSLGSWVILLLHDGCNTGQKCTDWELHELVKNCSSIFKTSPATCADYLQANDLHELHQGRSTDYLFSLKFWSLLCEHVQTKGDRWGGAGLPEKDTFMQHNNWMTPKGLHENHFTLWMFHYCFFIKTLSNQLLINYLQNCLNFLFKIVWKSLSTFLMSISPF